MRTNPDNLLPVDEGGGRLALADLIDAPTIQALMEDFYKLARIPMAIIDLDGRVLVGAGWQDVCTRFHRVHPETCKHCVESDTQLSMGVRHGEFRLYKCKNHMWDIATPIMVGGRQVGNIFSGQFFFEGEELDLDLFRSQARRYGFDEADYLAALRAVPRLSREAVNTGMSFFVKLADTLSMLGSSNIELARTLAEREAAQEALRESESFYRQTLESIPGMVFTTRPDGYCDYQSQQWVEFTGVPMSEHLGDGWNRLLHVEDRPRAFAAWQAAVEGRAPYDLEYRVRRHDGQYEWFKVIGRPIRDAAGQVVRWFGAAVNIEDIKRAEAGLKAAKVSAERAKATAEQANAAKDHFLAVLSHELRTPLTPVLTAAQMLEADESLPLHAREAAAMIRRNAELETRLIDDLLDLTRIARGKIDLSLEDVDLETVLRRTVEVCAPDIEARRVHFGLDVEGGPHRVRADAARLQQVFWNLLKNAIKFTPLGGCIGIRCRGGEGHAVVEVTDSGVGIEPAVLPRIFDAFEQGERQVTRQFGGLGLGLAISKSLVTLHGGMVSAHSEGKGKGSCFRVVLPTFAASAVAPAPAAAAAQAHVTRRGLRILVVEDHGDTARVLGQILRAAGHTVQTAGDVAAALDLAGREPLDLVISDLGLPDGTGLDLMRQLGQRHGLKGIALSGYGMEEDIRRSREAGFLAHLTKPVNLKKLAEVIESVSQRERLGLP